MVDEVYRAWNNLINTYIQISLYLKLMDLTVGNNFKLTKKINAGTFGEIYLGINLNNKKQVAIKLEQLKTKHPQLQY